MADRRTLQVRIAKFLNDKGYTADRRNNLRENGVTWRSFIDSDDVSILMASAKRGSNGSALVSDGFHEWDQIQINTFDEWLSFYAASATKRQNMPENRALPVMMGSHARLGAAGPLLKLPSDVLKAIAVMSMH